MKVASFVLPAMLFNRIKQPLAQEQEVCHPDKKKGKDHGPTKTLIMAVLLKYKGPRVRAVLTTYAAPHFLEPAKGRPHVFSRPSSRRQRKVTHLAPDI